MSPRGERALTEKRSLVHQAEEEYVKRSDWEVKENANTNLSYSNFMNFLYGKLIKKPTVLYDFLPKTGVDAHFSGDMHIHKLPHSLWIPYCAGWSLERILRNGLRTPNIISRPAKHFDTAVAHIVNYFFMAAQEWTGAQAASAFDLFMAPFVRGDDLDYRRLKQVLQGMLFELNYPARAGYQSPFTNITLMIDTSEEVLRGNAYIGGEVVGELGDYADEALMIDKALFELYLEGDAVGQPFTFPIPTLMITRNFDWNGRRWGEVSDLIFEALARRGTAYLLNGYSSNVEALYAMCCRLTIDTSKIFNNNMKLLLNNTTLDVKTSHRTYGIWAIPDATGSVGVVTLNLPRLAILSKGEWDVFESLLHSYMKIGREVLLAWRRRYELNMDRGLMPLTKTYLGHLNSHYNTFGVIGLPEAAANFLREPNLWFTLEKRKVREAIDVMKRIVRSIRKKAEEYEARDGYLYNVEEIPGESTGYRLAIMDYRLFRDKVRRGEILIPNDGTAVFYSNSVIPYYSEVSIYERALWEGEVQQEFTGGVMMHLFLDETPDVDSLKKLIRRIVMNTKVVYFSITPTIAVCRKCGWRGIGTLSTCPSCGSEVDLWSRIVGYYRPVRSWNIGKKAEFRLRRYYGSEAF